LDWGGQFVPEQVGLPALQAIHWHEHGDGPSDLDHAFHEFLALREATVSEVRSLVASSSIEQVLAQFAVAARRWDVRRSWHLADELLWQ